MRSWDWSEDVPSALNRGMRISRRGQWIVLQRFGGETYVWTPGEAYEIAHALLRHLAEMDDG